MLYDEVDSNEHADLRFQMASLRECSWRRCIGEYTKESVGNWQEQSQGSNKLLT